MGTVVIPAQGVQSIMVDEQPARHILLKVYCKIAPSLALRRRQLSANYFIRAMSVPSHPLKPFYFAIGLNRLYEALSFNIKPFSERAKAVLNDAHLSNINIQENNILAFPPWDIQIF
ncbi:hypothetical protein TNCV_3344901 [Trichonephila clavipes]|nr:hypothetical protein TNCV_3344901 [Trichonephila clavipes]